MPVPHAPFLENLRRRTAQAAIGPSALRNQGAPGVIAAARSAAANLDLSRYGKASAASIPTLLNEDTSALLALFPRTAQSWGGARKGLNLFLRDATYNIDLSGEFGLAKVRAHLEVPLDKDVATALLSAPEGAALPKWRSIKTLEAGISARFQAVAADVARRLDVNRVDLDVFYWRQRDASEP